MISGCNKTTRTAAGTATGDHAMTKNTATSTSALLASEVGHDPIEDRLRLNIRATIAAVFEEELEQFPAVPVTPARRSVPGQRLSRWSGTVTMAIPFRWLFCPSLARQGLFTCPRGARFRCVAMSARSFPAVVPRSSLAIGDPMKRRTWYLIRCGSIRNSVYGVQPMRLKRVIG